MSLWWLSLIFVAWILFLLWLVKRAYRRGYEDGHWMARINAYSMGKSARKTKR